MIVLVRSDPDRNMHRFYALDVTPTLFGNWSLICGMGAHRIAWGGPAPHLRR